MLSIALPDSMFSDEDTLRGKTVKAGQFARAASIFGCERIYIYRDPSENNERDYAIARAVLEYCETPQYLRRRLIRKNPNLEYVGLLPPLRTPSHLKPPQPTLNEVREAVLFFHNNELLADVGAKEPARLEGGRGQEGQRVTVKIDSTSPLRASLHPKPADVYWGYEVRRAPELGRFLSSADFELKILTSRLGEQISEIWDILTTTIKSARRTLVCFGSPRSGIHELLRREKRSTADYPKALVINTFPVQKVETVRLEEALLGTLAILNVAISL